MATKFPLWLTEFDDTKEFAVRVPFTLSGREFRVDEPFDKFLVTKRRLKQLYEQRKIVTSQPIAKPQAKARRAA